LKCHGAIRVNKLKRKLARDKVIEIISPLDNLKYFHNQQHRDKYIRNQSGRLAFSLNLIGDALVNDSVVLDLGVAPYFFAHLVRSVYGCEVYGLGLGDESVGVIEDHFGIQTSYCNMETGEFPFESSTFDVVLFCEVLEHLTMSPSHTISEIHRVLKTGGLLLLSTPNVTNIINRLRLLMGMNIFDKYSVDHVYGRHNRVFVKKEVEELLRSNNFQIEESRIFSDTRCFNNPISKCIAWSATLVNERFGHRIAVIARAVGRTKKVFPESLYRASLKTD